MNAYPINVGGFCSLIDDQFIRISYHLSFINDPFANISWKKALTRKIY